MSSYITMTGRCEITLQMRSIRCATNDVIDNESLTEPTQVSSKLVQNEAEHEGLSTTLLSLDPDHKMRITL